MPGRVLKLSFPALFPEKVEQPASLHTQTVVDTQPTPFRAPHTRCAEAASYNLTGSRTGPSFEVTVTVEYRDTLPVRSLL